MGAEHAVLYALHQRGRVRERGRERDVLLGEFRCRVRQVELVEYAFPVVGCEHGPVLSPEFLPLGEKPPQVGRV